MPLSNNSAEARARPRRNGKHQTPQVLNAVMPGSKHLPTHSEEWECLVYKAIGFSLCMKFHALQARNSVLRLLEFALIF